MATIIKPREECETSICNSGKQCPWECQVKRCDDCHSRCPCCNGNCTICKEECKNRRAPYSLDE